MPPPGPVSTAAVVPAKITIDIKAENGVDAPCTMIPIFLNVQMQAVPTQGATSASGTFQWATTSDKLMLSNETTQTVTVFAKGNVSAARDAEGVEVVFTPTGGVPLPLVHINVTVFDVAFSASPTQKYGFDPMDGIANADPHVSVKQSDDTTVHVKVLGGATGADIKFISSDPNTADCTPPASPGAEFDLTIVGKNKTKAAAQIRAHAMCGPKAYIKCLDVNVYAEKAISATVAKIYDSTSSGTTLSRPSFDVSAAQNLIKTQYKSAVVALTLTDQSSTGGAIDIRYDLNGNGVLDIEPGVTSPELAAILAVFNPTGQKIVIIKDMVYVFYLSAAAAVGATQITLKSSYGGNLSFVTVGSTYPLGTGATQENVTITARNSNVYTLAGPLTKAHPTSDGLKFPAAGLGGNPILLTEASAASADVQTWIIGHECGHALLGFDDLNAPDDLMNYSIGWTDHRLRFKDMPHHYDTSTESQWEKVSR